jgi:hypothetical protein
MDESGYWKAVARLRLERPRGLAALEDCFAAGGVPTGLDGPLKGRLLAFTVDHGVEGVFEALANLWLPWCGKAFDSAQGVGRNLFTAGGRRLIQLSRQGHRDLRPQGERRYSAYPFVTSTGPSELEPATKVLRIDYRDCKENPPLVRRVLDELVTVGDGLYLGQALIRWRGAMRRAAWFSLEG